MTEIEKIIEFILKEEVRDGLEYDYLYSIGEYGWQKLSSGKAVYIVPPPTTAKETGNALRSVLAKIK